MAFLSLPTLKIQSASVAQPLVGSWITAAAPSFTSPCNSPVVLTLGSASVAGNDAANIFRKNVEAWLIDPNGSHAEAVFIQSVSANTVTLGPKHSATSDTGISPVTEFPHVAGVFGTGTFIALNADLNNVIVISEPGATGPYLYIGNSYAMTANQSRIAELGVVTAGSQPNQFNALMYSPGNSFRLSEFWVMGGTVNDQYTPTCIQN